jgi:hypothetical protein
MVVSEIQENRLESMNAKIVSVNLKCRFKGIKKKGIHSWNNYVVKKHNMKK